MIGPHAIHRLVIALVHSVVEDERTSTDASRELLAGFAARHALDLHDFATLVRVAAGEAMEQLVVVPS